VLTSGLDLFSLRDYSRLLLASNNIYAVSSGCTYYFIDMIRYVSAKTDTQLNVPIRQKVENYKNNA